jgi:hypothetical protein
VIRLNYVTSEEEAIDGRYCVTLEIQCLEVDVAKLVEPLLKEGSKKTDILTFQCKVWVRDKIEFIENINFKSKETLKKWDELNF